MPDITMCSTGRECPLREHCYRWRAVPKKLGQSWSQFFDPNNVGQCQHFLKISDGAHFLKTDDVDAQFDRETG